MWLKNCPNWSRKLVTVKHKTRVLCLYLYPERRAKAKEHTRIGHIPFCTYSQCAKTPTPGVVNRGEKTKFCAKCWAVAYCGVECQKADWKTHKTIFSQQFYFQSTISFIFSQQFLLFSVNNFFYFQSTFSSRFGIQSL